MFSIIYLIYWHASYDHCTGIGYVLSLRFSLSFHELLWDSPSTAGVLCKLYYQVIVKNNVSSELLVNETTDNTYCPLPTLQRCQYYTANVTAFSSEYHGDSVVNTQRVPGGVCMCVHVCVHACGSVHACVCVCVIMYSCIW